MAEKHEKLNPRGPLTDAELAALEDLATISTGRPWQVHTEPLAVSEKGKEHGCKGGPAWVERSIHTAWDHGQMKGPAPVVTTMCGPFYEPNRAIHMREDDARFIVAACNAIHRLIAEVKKARRKVLAGNDIGGWVQALGRARNMSHFNLSNSDRTACGIHVVEAAPSVSNAPRCFRCTTVLRTTSARSGDSDG